MLGEDKFSNLHAAYMLTKNKNELTYKALMS